MQVDLLPLDLPEEIEHYNEVVSIIGESKLKMCIIKLTAIIFCRFVQSQEVGM